MWHVAIVRDVVAPRIPSELFGLEGVKTTGNGRHGIAGVGAGRLKWEAHSEFVTLTYIEPACPGQPLAPPMPFRKVVDATEGRVIAAVLVIVRTGEPPHSFGTEGDYVASKVGGGDAEVHSSFRLSDEGFVELHLFNKGLNAYRTGRMVRRLLEIETYRMMALLALPTAQQIVAELPELDQRLATLVDHLQAEEKVEKALLSEVTRLSSDILKLSANARQRFGATRAYADIVASRMLELREERVEQRQRICPFIDRRFQPAVRFVHAAERRLSEITERVGLASDLLRTSVQVQLEDQNAVLLKSMEERARVQVHIQQAVEGFSVIAISYYAVGLAKACLESVGELGLDVHAAKAAFFFTIPAVVFAVWVVIRHVRRNIAAGSPAH
ncbi:putative membrane-anchored protein [Rhizobium leucaenae]|uniref:Putative membrane-anchored protein n=1 Tax=Rhizobium leucaenae TaxID=29450 RepID=A0A7W7EPY5_9HYPH|nr:putative membrane-anchored protein [Rhizobium leucaenae]